MEQLYSMLISEMALTAFGKCSAFIKLFFYGAEQIGATFLSEIFQNVCALLLSQATYWWIKGEAFQKFTVPPKWLQWNNRVL